MMADEPEDGAVHGPFPAGGVHVDADGGPPHTKRLDTHRRDPRGPSEEDHEQRTNNESTAQWRRAGLGGVPRIVLGYIDAPTKIIHVL